MFSPALHWFFVLIRVLSTYLPDEMNISNIYRVSNIKCQTEKSSFEYLWWRVWLVIVLTKTSQLMLACWGSDRRQWDRLLSCWLCWASCWANCSVRSGEVSGFIYTRMTVLQVTTYNNCLLKIVSIFLIQTWLLGMRGRSDKLYVEQSSFGGCKLWACFLHITRTIFLVRRWRLGGLWEELF